MQTSPTTNRQRHANQLLANLHRRHNLEDAVFKLSLLSLAASGLAWGFRAGELFTLSYGAGGVALLALILAIRSFFRLLTLR